MPVDTWCTKAIDEIEGELCHQMIEKSEGACRRLLKSGEACASAQSVDSISVIYCRCHQCHVRSPAAKRLCGYLMQRLLILVLLVLRIIAVPLLAALHKHVRLSLLHSHVRHLLLIHSHHRLLPIHCRVVTGIHLHVWHALLEHRILSLLALHLASSSNLCAGSLALWHHRLWHHILHIWNLVADRVVWHVALDISDGTARFLVLRFVSWHDIN
mmetsp:Transcript_4452/g.13504  ORF Transcript_4452/g.13504 Transcript_4452/m.13504 type:complete len:214 (-) Transcript_4452:784-1425(-)